MRKRICRERACILFLIFFLFLSVVSFQTRAAEPKTLVRVGFVQLQGFLFQQENGEYGGVAYDLLQEIAVYNNWEYEFIECGYAECGKFFDEDKIDLFISFQKTPERSLVYEYSKEVFCQNRACLLTMPEASAYYEDFASIDGMTVGIAQGTRNGERFVSFLREHGCHITIQDTYRDDSELLQATQAGEIDAFISASNRSLSGCKQIAVLPETDSYIVAPKGNRQYLDPLDLAIRKINLENPNLINELNEKYQTSAVGAYPALTREESAYIQQRQEVTVLIGAQECDQNGQFAGSAKVMFDNLHELTGLSFVPVIEKETDKIYQYIGEGKADMMYAFHHDYAWGAENNVWITQPYASFYNMLVTRKNKGDVKSVAVIPGNYISYYLDKNMDYQIVEATSYRECMDLVLKGQADATYITSLIGNYYATFPKYKTLSFLSAYDFRSSYCLAVSRESDHILVDILNKAIAGIPRTVLLDAFENQVQSRQIRMRDLFYAYPVVFIGSILVLMLAVAMLLFLLIHNRSMKRKNEQLAIANNAKTDFMSRMSHDMRTPMNGILGLAKLSRDETDISVIQDNLEQIEMSGKFLLNLINDTLDMNRIEAGKMELHLKPIDSEEVLKNVLVNAAIIARDKGVRLKLQLPNISHGHWIPVLADASRLEQILINVISNAIKFTPSGGIVTLEMKNLIANKYIVKDQYVIRDNGIGMSESFLKTIYEPFSQESRINSRREQGTGLGMSIVKQLVDLMGGEIHIKSEIGKGTEVTLIMQFTAYDGELEQKEAQVSNDVSLQGKKCLLVEDHPLNAQIAIKLMEKQGAITEHALDGKEGLEMFEQSDLYDYDFILMDVRMPVMNGIEATMAIRQLQRADAATIPIIAMTANAFEEDIRMCKEAGMNDHISKPVEPEVMYETIKKYLKGTHI